MSKVAVIRQLDERLQTAGFHRSKQTWNRKSASFVDVIELQVSKDGDDLTVNVGVLDPEVHQLCWGAPPASTVYAPGCTAEERAGRLLPEGRDLWLPIDDAQTPDRIVAVVTDTAIPFIEGMHSRAAIAQWLIDQDVLRRKYPPPIIYLAILLHLSGDEAQSCAILDRLRATTVDAWANRVRDVSIRLGCP